MKSVAERLDTLRRRMADENVAAVLVPTADPHASEYIADHFRLREYLSGFTGSAGSLFVLKDRAYLFTDSRYFIQADKELEGSGIELMRSGTEGVPLLSDFIKSNVKGEEILAFDGRLISSEFIEKINTVKTKTDFDPADKVWEERPELIFSDPYFIDVRYNGESTKNKLERIRTKIKENGADCHVLTSLTDIAWICNMRADDIEHTPVFYSYMYVDGEKAVLFAGPDESAPAWNKAGDVLSEEGISLKPYSTAETGISELINGHKKILINKACVNSYLTELIEKSGAETVNALNPSSMLKAVKNEAELNGMRQAHIKDAASVIRFIARLKSGEYGHVTERSAAEKLISLRKEQEGYLDESFDPIMAYGEHGAIVHYSADESSDVEIGQNSILLFDTGAHYKNEGTTDITRTIALGKPRDNDLWRDIKRHYTLVLKAHLAILTAVFPKGVKGSTIDALAREVLWKEGLDYGHGTGHGVGHLLSVHEGPQSFSTHKGKNKTNETPIVPGMITSDEPGLYFEGRYGIRTESLVECVDLGKEDKKYEGFYGFKPLTLVPFDIDLIDVSLLSPQEIKAINDYHTLILKTLTPLFPEQDLPLLQQVCQELKQGNQDPQNN